MKKVLIFLIFGDKQPNYLKQIFVLKPEPFNVKYGGARSKTFSKVLYCQYFIVFLLFIGMLF